MSISGLQGLNSLMTTPEQQARMTEQRPALPTKGGVDEGELREKFQQFVGETFYGQLLKQMRKTVPESKYFNGGNAEKVFRQQLDQMLSTEMAEKSAEKLSEPMYDLFQMQRRPAPPEIARAQAAAAEAKTSI